MRIPKTLIASPVRWDSQLRLETHTRSILRLLVVSAASKLIVCTLVTETIQPLACVLCALGLNYHPTNYSAIVQ